MTNLFKGEVLLLSAHHNVPCVLKQPADRYDHPFAKVYASPAPQYDRQSSMNFMQFPSLSTSPSNSTMSTLAIPIAKPNTVHLAVPTATSPGFVAQSASNLAAPMPQFGFLTSNSKQR